MVITLVTCWITLDIDVITFFWNLIAVVIRFVQLSGWSIVRSTVNFWLQFLKFRVLMVIWLKTFVCNSFLHSYDGFINCGLQAFPKLFLTETFSIIFSVHRNSMNLRTLPSWLHITSFNCFALCLMLNWTLVCQNSFYLFFHVLLRTITL